MKRALVVDDKEENLYYLNALLTGYGYVVDTARQGAEALAAARQTPPDIVISDLLMPVMDGFTLLRHWKADPDLKRIPFIVYTATYTSAQDERLVLDLGADAFIVKPSEPDDFMARIRLVKADASSATPSIPREPVGDQRSLMRQYNEVVVHKLEQKIAEQEATRRALTHEVTVRKEMAEIQRAILDALPALVGLLDSDGTVLAVNEAWRQSTASNSLQDPNLGPGVNYLSACAKAEAALSGDAHDAARGIRHVLAGDAQGFTMEYSCHLSDVERWFQLTVTPMRREGSGGAVVMHLDVTERRKREAQLRQQSALLDNAKDAITVRNLDNRIVYWNRAAETLYGWRRDEVLGRPIDDFLHAHNPARFTAAKEVALAKGEWAGRFVKTTKDGRRVTVEANWTLVRDDRGAPVSIFAVDTDITERLALEEQLARSQKMEAVGQLTGGVAHDFNNLLGVISGNLELLDEQLQNRPELSELVQIAIRATDRGVTLTRSLLAFSCQQPLDPRPVDANVMVREMTALLRRTVPETIEIGVAPRATWQCEVDPGQLQNAILNLVLNARDAMPEGGRLTLETGNATLDAAYAAAHVEVTPGEYVMVAVSDTGLGMKPEVVARAFEPFFTTKEVGKGTGLGLSMVYGFAKQSLGHIMIYSEPGQGTTVRIYLPRSSADPRDRAVSDDAAADTPPPRGRGETILVVEDDEHMRALTSELLRSLDYKVVVAEEARSALRLLQEDPQIAVLLTDVILPGGMNGRQLADEAIHLSPIVKVVYMSGYSENAILHHGRLDPGVQLLEKPFSKRTLAAKIRAVLDREIAR
jgi:PAS domain S-box-containing protein